jgi:23S rRNA (cytidine1920-2'-O)/16S rRNA (cytidine1409-2'-O)-methyltransferase
VMDVSFISIRLIIPVLFSLMGKEGRLISLVKPQFEAGRGQVGKHGVVREADTHLRVLRDIRDFVAQQGLCLAGCTFSPITGPKGNVEFLADIGYDMNRSMDDAALAEVVSQAHRTLL